MKFTLVILSVVCCGCLAVPVEVEQNRVQKRSIGGDQWLGGYYGGSYGLSSSALLSTPSISSLSLSAPSISSHTHSHSTAIIDRPYPVAIQTPTITSAAILPSTLSYNYGLSSYPSSIGYPSTYGSSYSSPSISSYSSPYYGSYGSLGYRARSYNPGYGKYYSRSYPTSIYKKSYYSSSPSYKYKW